MYFSRKLDLEASIKKIESSLALIEENIVRDERELTENLEKFEDFENLESTSYEDVETWKRSFQRQAKNTSEKLSKISKNFLEKEALRRQKEKQLTSMRSKLQNFRDELDNFESSSDLDKGS